MLVKTPGKEEAMQQRPMAFVKKKTKHAGQQQWSRPLKGMKISGSIYI